MKTFVAILCCLALLILAVYPAIAQLQRDTGGVGTTNADSIKAKPIPTTPGADQDGMYLLYDNDGDTCGWATPAGAGDMTKAVYDAGDDGVVDSAAGAARATTSAVADSTAGGAARAETAGVSDSTNGGAVRAETAKNALLADSTSGGAARAESSKTSDVADSSDGGAARAEIAKSALSADTTTGGAARATTAAIADSTNGGAARAETAGLADSTDGGAARATTSGTADTTAGGAARATTAATADYADSATHLTDGTVDEADLAATNSPTDNYVLSYDDATKTFTWAEDQAGAGADSIFSWAYIDACLRLGQDADSSGRIVLYWNGVGDSMVIDSSGVHSSDTLVVIGADTLRFDAGGSLLINGDQIKDFTGAGLTVSSNALSILWTWLWEFIDSTTATPTDTDTTATATAFQAYVAAHGGGGGSGSINYCGVLMADRDSTDADSAYIIGEKFFFDGDSAQIGSGNGSVFIGDAGEADSALQTTATIEKTIDERSKSADSLRGIIISTTPSSDQDGMYLVYDSDGDTCGWNAPSGSGDMTKAVYDQNDNGVIDTALGADRAAKAALADSTNGGAIRAETAKSLGANGANASAGNAILGVDAAGAAEGAFDVWTEAENTAAAYQTAANVNTLIKNGSELKAKIDSSYSIYNRIDTTAAKIPTAQVADTANALHGDGDSVVVRNDSTLISSGTTVIGSGSSAVVIDSAHAVVYIKGDHTGTASGDSALVTIETIEDSLATRQPLEATLTDIADGTIVENLVNTANPWDVNEGGSGANTFTDGGILLGSGTGAFTALGAATNGQIPIGDGTTDPVLATLTEGEGIDVTNGAGTITLAGEDASTTNKGIASFDADDFDVSSGAVSIDNTNFTLADIPGGTAGANAFDFGGATSVEIPNVDNPTTDAEGEIAWDSDDDAIEVYSGDETESGLIPFYQKIDAMIFKPDQVNDQVAIFHVDELLYPFGIEIDQVSITIPADAAYSMVFEEWAGDPPAAQADIETVTTGAADSYMEDGTITNDQVDANDYIFLDIPVTDVDWIHVQVIYHVIQGD